MMHLEGELANLFSCVAGGQGAHAVIFLFCGHARPACREEKQAENTPKTCPIRKNYQIILNFRFVERTEYGRGIWNLKE